MQPERFDQLARTLGGAVSRRQALKLLLSSAIGGLVGLVSAATGRKITAAQGTDLEPLVYLPLLRHDCTYSSGAATYEMASEGELAIILEAAEGNEEYQDLRWLLENSDRSVTEQVGAIIFRSGHEVAHVAIVHYTRSDSPDPAYLVYAVNECDEYTTFALNLELENEVALGFYKNAQSTIQVEVVDLAPPFTSLDLQSDPIVGQESSTQITESCQLCLDSCTNSQQIRDTTCTITSIVAAADMVMTGRSLYRRAAAGVSHVIVDIVEDALDVNAIRSSAGGIRDCVEQDRLTCTEDGGMCRDVCVGCGVADGISCQGDRLCSGGECRTPCGDTLCRASEACVEGRCEPLEHSCGEYIPMGWYNFVYRWGPACCALSPAIDCGAKDDEGHWLGCCPLGTLCGRYEGGVYGCCFPGVNC